MPRMVDSDSSDDDSGTRRQPFVYYRDRPQWKDIVPIPQDDGPNPVVAINYTEKFKDVYDYIRAILAKQEKSERALTLTEDALRLNPANYTVWQYRREILKHLKCDLKKELANHGFLDNLIFDHPKNYQVWYHRKAIIEMLGDPCQEAEVTRQYIQYDSKNYHAWQHRQWIIQTFGLYDGELEFVERLLEIDIRNNSAWNHRFFIVSNTTGFTPEVVTREVDFTLEYIKQATHNESAWNYLRGVLEKSEGGISGNSKVSEFCESLASSKTDSHHLYIFLVDIFTARAKTDPQAAKRVKELCHLLAKEMDPIRENYWNFLSQQV